MKTKIFLIRNAECEADLNKIVGDIPDSKITENGYKTIEILKEYLKNERIYKIYSSPSNVCLETVNKLAEELNITIEKKDGLKEKYFGIHNGKSWDEIKKLEPEIAKFKKRTNEILGIKGQETNRTLKNRFLKCMYEISKNNLGQNIVVVSHCHAIEIFLRAVADVPFMEDKDKYFQKNAAINYIEYDEDIDEFEIKQLAKIIY